ncbi:MAG: GNAT family N-acetyltransferase [Magnetospirillum sp.]|nr:GNAT family N-acetyltransferase [Magnetospirillum sp.]
MKHFPAPSASLAARGVALRAETPDDHAFLERLYVSVRWVELAVTDWTDDAKLAFLTSQYGLQVRHYTQHYSDSAFAIVVLDGEPIGRLYLYRGKTDLRIVDISLLPQCRGSGIGTQLLNLVFDEARATGKTVSIHVEKFNPAQTLYHRLGFHQISESGPYRLMEWRSPDPPSLEEEESPCPPT